MIVLVLLCQLKPVHFYMQVFEQVHLLLCQRLELWWTTSSVVHEVVADVATTKADADGIVWHREKPADIVTAPVIKSFGDKRDVFYAACKREEVGCWIFQVEMFEFESIHELGDQLDIKKSSGKCVFTTKQSGFQQSSCEVECHELGRPEILDQGPFSNRILTYRPSDFVHFVVFEIISANYDIFKAYFVEEAF